MKKSPNKIIAVSAVLSGGIVLADNGLQGNWPEGRQVTGFAIAFFIIAAISDLGADTIASTFAMLLLVSIILNNGPSLLDQLNTKTKGK